MVNSKTYRLNLIHSFAMLLGFLLDLYVGRFVFVPFLAASSFVMFIVGHQSLLVSMKPFGGLANWVTLFRLLGIFWIVGNYAIVSEFTTGIVALVVVVLDGVDGYLARKTNTATEFGAFFDMETDAFFCAIMTFIIYKLHPELNWLLIPGLLRYFYVVLIKTLRMHDIKERGHKLGKWFAVLFFMSLIAPFLTTKEVYEPLLLFSSVLIVYSFSYSFWYLARDNRTKK